MADNQRAECAECQPWWSQQAEVSVVRSERIDTRGKHDENENAENDRPAATTRQPASDDEERQ
jgi:hypothetical protein